MRALAVLVVAAAVAVSAAQAPRGDLHVLFVGNSLTAANDLPALVEQLGRSGAGPRVKCETIAFPNYSLEDHWSRGDAVAAIRRGGWTTVVLQQGPSALPESRVLLREYTRRFAGEIRRAGAAPALYMVWPAADRRGDFDGVKTSYQLAARDVSGAFLPVGEAWRAAWARDAHVDLYGPDGFHPTRAASYLAALVIYQQLTGQPPPRDPPFAMPPALASLLQQAAVDATRAAPPAGRIRF